MSPGGVLVLSGVKGDRPPQSRLRREMSSVPMGGVEGPRCQELGPGMNDRREVACAAPLSTGECVAGIGQDVLGYQTRAKEARRQQELRHGGWKG